jgi:predicted metal-dependent HD superfamily phosphohydrolase
MLRTRWLRLCESVGLDGCAQWQSLSSAYEAPDRAYHNMNHIADCLLLFDGHVSLATDRIAVEFAIWFHDIVCDTHAQDNEERSAVVAAEFLSVTSHGPVVADLIRATRHDGQHCTTDAALICDIDLSILGRPAAVYDAYARAIRQEYAWVPIADFVTPPTSFDWSWSFNLLSSATAP